MTSARMPIANCPNMRFPRSSSVTLQFYRRGRWRPSGFTSRRYGDARALLRDTVYRLERILPHNDPLLTELREILADIGDE